MKAIKTSFRQMVAAVPPEIKEEASLEVAISNRIYELMTARGLSKVEFARALGKRPNEITKWLSGQHNFTVRTIALLSVFFKEDLISVSAD